MKIDNDLRQALRHVCAQAKDANSWQERSKRRRAAVDNLLARKPKLAQQLELAKLNHERADAEAEKHLRFIRSHGLNPGLNDIQDDARFKRAGGKPPQPGETLRFERVMVQLAKATDKEGAALLRKLGVKWKGVT